MSGTIPLSMTQQFENAHWDIEGPVYADRVNGKLTYRDWEGWEPEDQLRWPKPSDVRV